MLYYYVFCINTCRFWKILTVLSNVILYHNFLSTFYVPNYHVHKNTYFEKVLSILLTVILPYILILSMSVTTYSVHTAKDFEIYELYY